MQPVIQKVQAFLRKNGIAEELWPYLASLSLVAVCLTLYTFVLASLSIKDLILSCMAMVLNAILGLMQIYIIYRVFELKSDHINHFDVEKAMRQLVMPEQAIQVENIFLSHTFKMVKVLRIGDPDYVDSHSLFELCMLPLAIWHFNCILSQKAPVRAVLGKSEEFERSLATVQKISLGKALFYTLTMMSNLMRIYALFPTSGTSLGAPSPLASVRADSGSSSSSSGGGWSGQFFRIPHGTSKTPYGFDHLSLIAEVPAAPYLDMSSEAALWASFSAMSRVQYAGDAKTLPSEWYAWRFFGKVMVRKGGFYNFCTESDDGSLLFIDTLPISRSGPAEDVSYTLLVDNDGLHGRMKRCKDIQLRAGGYNIKVAGFESGGGMTMRVHYSGPDTNNLLVLAPSFDASRPANPDGRDGWSMQLFSIPQGTSQTPTELQQGDLIGENRHLAAVQLDNDRTCSTYIPGCPDDWFAWRFYGLIQVDQPGEYTFCSESDDGSLFYMDLNHLPIPAAGQRLPQAPRGKLEYTLVIDNDGLHSPRQRCKIVELEPGLYPAKVVGFEAVGMPLMTLKHKGPDTKGDFVWTRSVDSSPGS